MGAKGGSWSAGAGLESSHWSSCGGEGSFRYWQCQTSKSWVRNWLAVLADVGRGLSWAVRMAAARPVSVLMALRPRMMRSVSSNGCVSDGPAWTRVDSPSFTMYWSG